MDNTVWLAFDVGCIECGEGSTAIGLFKTEAEADHAAAANQEIHEANWHGQHYFVVFEMTLP